MTTQSMTHERQHELIEGTLHEIRGDLKWIMEELGHDDDGESRLDRLESKVDRILEKLDA